MTYGGSDKKDDKPQVAAPPGRRQAKLSSRDKIAAVMRRNPGLKDDREIARRAGVSLRTVQRARGPNGRSTT